MNPVLRTASVFRMIRHCCQHEPYGLVLSSVRSCLMSRAKSEKWKSARANCRSRFHLYVYAVYQTLSRYLSQSTVVCTGNLAKTAGYEKAGSSAFAD